MYKPKHILEHHGSNFNDSRVVDRRRVSTVPWNEKDIYGYRIGPPFSNTYSETQNLVVFCSRRQTETACRGHPVIRSIGKLPVFANVTYGKWDVFVVEGKAFKGT